MSEQKIDKAFQNCVSFNICVGYCKCADNAMSIKSIKF